MLGVYSGPGVPLDSSPHYPRYAKFVLSSFSCPRLRSTTINNRPWTLCKELERLQESSGSPSSLIFDSWGRRGDNTPRDRDSSQVCTETYVLRGREGGCHRTRLRRHERWSRPRLPDRRGFHPLCLRKFVGVSRGSPV